MKRPIAILILGLLLALAGFGGFYFSATSHQKALLNSRSPELAWLKSEFNLSEAEYQRISELHEGYLPQCAEMCRRIAAKTAELETLMEEANSVTPQIEQTLQEASQLRAECHRNMLKHFFAVSQAMPPNQGKRYLDWVKKQTVLQQGGMMAAQHEGHEGHE